MICCMQLVGQASILRERRNVDEDIVDRDIDEGNKHTVHKSFRALINSEKSFVVQGKRYTYVAKKKDWEGARRTCQKRGGDLAIILSDEEFDGIVKQIPYVPNGPITDPSYIYVGARYNNSNHNDNSYNENNFFWVSGEPLLDNNDLWGEYHVQDYNRCVAINGGVTAIDKWHPERNRPSLANIHCYVWLEFLCQFV